MGDGRAEATIADLRRRYRCTRSRAASNSTLAIVLAFTAQAFIAQD